jgi:hypothetical protein
MPSYSAHGCFFHAERHVHFTGYVEGRTGEQALPTSKSFFTGTLRLKNAPFGRVPNQPFTARLTQAKLQVVSRPDIRILASLSKAYFLPQHFTGSR